VTTRGQTVKGHTHRPCRKWSAGRSHSCLVRPEVLSRSDGQCSRQQCETGSLWQLDQLPRSLATPTSLLDLSTRSSRTGLSCPPTNKRLVWRQSINCQVEWIDEKKSKVNSIPGQALRDPGGWDSHISRQSAHEGRKVVSPTHQPPLPTRKYSCYSFLLEAEVEEFVNEKFQ